MINLAFTGGQSAGDFPQALGVAQLAEHHRYELIPAAKSAGVALGFVLLDGGFKLEARDKLQYLTENAAYFIHGGVLLSGRFSFILET
jgi:hypothetical protein